MVCYRRVLDLKPDSADGKVHHSLGLEYLRMGCFAEAAEIWEHWLRTDPQAPVARHMAAAATAQDVPARASDDYVRSTFETFAPTFDQQLQALDYRVPAMTAAAVAKALGDPAGNLLVLDAGCGTGLCGPLLRPFARRLTGVDLSPAMLQRAQARQVYDDLITGELTAHLQRAEGSYDLIVAADTLVYFGDLRPIFAAAAYALRSGGLFVFSLEQDCGEGAPQRDFRLQPHGRYCHAAEAVRRTLAEVRLRLHELTFGTLRTELGQPVAGMIVVAEKSRGLDSGWVAPNVAEISANGAA
jgi:predicted TPR repeat methyltransferase